MMEKLLTSEIEWVVVVFNFQLTTKYIFDFISKAISQKMMYYAYCIVKTFQNERENTRD